MNDLEQAPVSRRRFGLVTATALVVGNMIGTGVFTTGGFLLAELGSPRRVLLAWLGGGLIALCGALSYGALCRRIPESGGEYIFISRTLHPAVGNIAGWISLLVGFSAPLAAAAFGFGEYTKDWFAGWSPQWLGTLLLLFLASIHAVHVGVGTSLQNLAVLINVLCIALFLILAFQRLPVLPQSQGDGGGTGAGAYAVSLVWIYYSYAGWNAAAYVGGEVRDPERTLPLSLLAGTALVTLLYLALNAAFVFAAPVAELAGKADIGRAAALALGGPVWANAITGLVVMGLATSASAMMMVGPRVYARMAEDGIFPRRFAEGSGAPYRSVALQCGLALALLWSSTFRGLLTYVGFTLSLSTAVTVVGLIRLKLIEGDRLPVFGWPWVPVLFLVAVAWMIVFAVSRQPLESAMSLATIVACWLAWWSIRGR
ncbi:MAG: amino acid permease-associated region [Proteobacteria bacterium]|nr:amino acid permease-associated region [Pseudomonadota bacterium]